MERQFQDSKKPREAIACKTGPHKRCARDHSERRGRQASLWG